MYVLWVFRRHRPCIYKLACTIGAGTLLIKQAVLIFVEFSEFDMSDALWRPIMMLWMAVGLIVGLGGIAHIVFIREECSPNTRNDRALKRLAEELQIEFSLENGMLQDNESQLGVLHGT